MISFREFEVLAAEYNVIPLVHTMLADTHTPVSTYLTLREGASGSFLFETVEQNEKIGRHSFIGINPSVIVKARGDSVEVKGNGLSEAHRGNIFTTLAQLSGRFRQPEIPPMKGFLGGFVGYIGYSNVAHLEKLAIPEPGVHDEHDAIFGLFDSIVRFDHWRQLITIIHNVILRPGAKLRQQYDEGKKVVDTLELRLRRIAVTAHSFSCDTKEAEQGMDKQAYVDAVKRAKHYIVEGDIFQVVLSRQIRLRFSGDLFAVYRALRMINPSPYLYFVDFEETKLVGSSPEVLVRVQKGLVEVLPIAGTRGRGKTEQEDLDLEEELLSDTKELAEHVMLVDLGRNDVGRISEYGTVHVPVFKKIERYSHVMHIVSEVQGKLKAGASALEALKCCFPAGTVSGAPKVRAMEIINELEEGRRGVYAGAVGYLGFNGSLDTCIAIRTIVAHRDTLKIQAGAGIVADSVPEKEYQETLNKSQALKDAVVFAASGLSPSFLQAGGKGKQP